MLSAASAEHGAAKKIAQTATMMSTQKKVRQRRPERETGTDGLFFTGGKIELDGGGKSDGKPADDFLHGWHRHIVVLARRINLKNNIVISLYRRSFRNVGHQIGR